MGGGDNRRNPRSLRRPVAVDLFAGAGGFSLGFEQAGFDVVACVEYDPIHAAVHKFNFPRAEVLCTDLLTVSDEDLHQAVRKGCEAHGREEGVRPQVDVVIGGPPCQGFSVGGKLRFDDERNRLVFAFARAVGLLEPQYFVMENVPAIRSAVDSESAATLQENGRGSLLNALFREFDRLGYDVCEEEVLNACEFGVPQDRRRVILVGVLRGTAEPSVPLPTVHPRPKRSSASKPDHEPANTLPLGPSVSEAIRDLPDVDRYETLLSTDEVLLEAKEWPSHQASIYAKRLSGKVQDPEDFSYPRRWNRKRLTSSLRTTHTPATVARFSATPPGTTEPVSRFYRLDPGGLCNTLRAGTGYERGSFSAPRPIHPEMPRVISVREAARLQSFPDWFRFHVTKWHGFRQVGNALPPLLARALGQSIAKSLDIEPVRPAEKLTLGDPKSLCWGMQEATARLGAHAAAPSHGDRTRARASKAPDLLAA